MKTYLITGGAGFIDSNFIHYMLKIYNNIKMINLDKLIYDASNLENLKCVDGNLNYIFVQADLCDKESVESLFKEYDICYVVNFVAESHVYRSIRKPEISVKNNVLGSVTLFNAAKNLWRQGN